MPTEDELVVEGMKETESEILNEAFNDAAPEQTPETDAVEETADNRDPATGQFVAKDKTDEQPEQTTAETPQDEPEDHGQVPSWRLREVAEARRAAEAKAEAESKRNATLEAHLQEMQRRVASLEKPKTETQADELDPLVDPQGFAKRLEDRFEAKRREDQLNFSMALAHSKHGEKFDKAWQALIAEGQAGNRQLVHHVTSQPNPGEALVKWWSDHETLREVGSDPATYKAKLLEEAMKDPAFQAKVIEAVRNGQASNGQQRPNNVTQLPPSLSRATGSKSSASPTDETDDSDAAVFSYAFR